MTWGIVTVLARTYGYTTTEDNRHDSAWRFIYFRPRKSWTSEQIGYASLSRPFFLPPQVGKGSGLRDYGIGGIQLTEILLSW